MSGFEINTSNIPCVPILSQIGQLWIFRPKFGEVAQLGAIFWFKYCSGRCRELGGGWNELGGGGWSWVEVGALFSNTLFLISLKKNTAKLFDIYFGSKSLESFTEFQFQGTNSTFLFDCKFTLKAIFYINNARILLWKVDQLPCLVISKINSNH